MNFFFLISAVAEKSSFLSDEFYETNKLLLFYDIYCVVNKSKSFLAINIALDLCRKINVWRARMSCGSDLMSNISALFHWF